MLIKSESTHTRTVVPMFKMTFGFIIFLIQIYGISAEKNLILLYLLFILHDQICYTYFLGPISSPHAANTNGCSLLMSPSVFLSRSLLHTFLLLMDRWHPIVYWAKVQCLIGHSSGNWASVSA